MTFRRLARCVIAALVAAAAFVTPSAAQDGYRTPPDAITKMNMAPGGGHPTPVPFRYFMNEP